jgi:hypothetical protein
MRCEHCSGVLSQQGHELLDRVDQLSIRRSSFLNADDSARDGISAVTASASHLVTRNLL